MFCQLHFAMNRPIPPIAISIVILFASGAYADEDTDSQVRVMPLVVNPLSDLVGGPERRTKEAALKIAEKISKLYRKDFKETGEWPRPFKIDADPSFYRGSILLGAAGRMDYYSVAKHGAFTLFLFADGKIIGEWDWPFLDNQKVKQLPAQVYSND